MSITVSAPTAVARTYTDFNMNFFTNPFTKDITKKTNEDAIKFSIINLIMTRKYERPFHPEISSDVQATLFDNYSIITKAVLQRTIEDVIKNFEPRAKLISVDIDPTTIDSNAIGITIKFSAINSTRPVVVSLQLTRAR